jgi:tetratricopeptide (TPR) repeat protein
MFHGDLHERIQLVSSQIDENSEDPELYVKRGDLYFQHEDFVASVSDFKQAIIRNTEQYNINYLLARSYYELDEIDSSEYYLNKQLAVTPDYFRALQLLGHSYEELGQYESSVKYLITALDHIETRIPKNYLDIIDAYRKCEKDLQITQAVKWCDNAIHDLGPLVVFYDRKIDLCLKSGRLTDAIQSLDEVIKINQQKEKWLVKRAHIYLSLGMKEEAIKDVQVAFGSFEKLPTYKIKTPYIQNLIKQMNEILDNIN